MDLLEFGRIYLFYLFKLIWIYLDLFRFIWIYSNLFGFIRIYLGLFEFIRIYLDIFKFVWIYCHLFGPFVILGGRNRTHMNLNLFRLI